MELVLEIGTEELPAGFQLDAVKWMRDNLRGALEVARLDFDSVTGGDASFETHATPRRLALIARDVAEHSDAVPKIHSGPPVKIAVGPDGKFTKAAESFAKKVGVPIASLKIDGERVIAEQMLVSQPARELLPEILAKLVSQIPFKKSMRWGDGSETFARPVQWIGASFGGDLVAFDFADVKSGLTSMGHRFHDNKVIDLPRADAYVETLRKHRVLADWEERKAAVWAEVKRAAGEFAPGAQPRIDPELLETVTGLVEEPHAVLGNFEQHFLELPPEVLVSEMRGHQKYFAVQDASGKLLPAFVAVSNTKVDDPKVSQRGYERVLRARLSDGRFFFDEDRKVTLASRVERLGRITFFNGLGTQGERSERIRELAAWLHRKTGKANAELLEQAARLCKADLTCGMVSEFPELQGTMGKVYALHEGLPAKVANALFEHWLPRGAEDKLPEGDEGALIGVADRLDQLVGFFGLGHEASGTADPYGLRRAAIGLLRLVLGKGLRLDLHEAIEVAQWHYLQQKAKGAQIRVTDKATLPGTVWQFITGRLESLWKDRAPDAIAAVLGVGSRDVVSLEKRLEALCEVRASQPEQFAATAGAYKRIGNILEQARSKNLTPMAFRAELAKLPAEQKLAAALTDAREQVRGALGAAEAWPLAYGVLAELRPAVDGFFDDVMVMVPDEAQRDNRLALLRSLRELLAPLADFGRLQA
jgi:glycyl-tRNA synthetase beta chain